jgi:hypothetical protein
MLLPLFAVSADNRVVHRPIKTNLPPVLLINIEEQVVCPFHYFPDYLPLLLQLSKYVSTETKCVSMRQYPNSVYIDAPQIKNPLSILINNYRASLGMAPVEVDPINTDPINLLSMYIRKHSLSRRESIN